MKIKVQAQHLQPGDIIGSGETIAHVQTAALYMPKGKVSVTLRSADGSARRSVYWGKYTQINAERAQ